MRFGATSEGGYLHQAMTSAALKEDLRRLTFLSPGRSSLEPGLTTEPADSVTQALFASSASPPSPSPFRASLMGPVPDLELPEGFLTFSVFVSLYECTGPWGAPNPRLLGMRVGRREAPLRVLRGCGDPDPAGDGEAGLPDLRVDGGSCFVLLAVVEFAAPEVVGASLGIL